ncbi:MAG TPA: fluoride efflux transporter CrcB [Zoogloea sp.]|jgi:CrcB protein|uniref:fluoride efflux transporter CrcB n=1 Tax=Zoogloea sp. TaxID=49181 RepID=UPI001B4BE0ED|nr:fluoride efflux transporter CrcB [Zoogloea sp.]MBP8266676.1 fluoride efflux transporter CrcB [Zoogloea sp.]HOB46919.1 fluoride efflux transporter CrcB [Zoogloea sp.]HQA08982.1 fluoride efflux transporter CrcB [Zoogloea sp.]HQE38234.1 fluoride efflux transporter CrcB [Zoogloea sp.]
MSDHAHHFPVLAFAAIGIGAALGAWLRWWLGLRLNPVLAHLPLGTLSANLLGGYLIGVAVAFFALRTDIPPEVRLFVVTGFLGGLTTFSSFSAEVVHLIDTARYAWAAAAAAVHVCGSLCMTALGMWTVHLVRS